MVADTNGSLITNGRLLVATLLLPDTISFQVPAREKESRLKNSNSKLSIAPTRSLTAPISGPNSHSTASRTTSIYPLSAVDTSNGAMSDQAFMSSRQSPPPELNVAPTGERIPSAPPSPGFYRATASSTEAITSVPKPISNKAERLKDQDRSIAPLRSTYHGHGITPPASILMPPVGKKELLSNVFPAAAPPPVLNQPRSRTTDPPSISTFKGAPVHRRSSTDSAKVFAEASWTVEKASGGNIGLHNAVNSIQSQLSKQIWVGTLGMPTDSLPDRTRGDIRAELAVNHDSIPVFVNDIDFEGHYHQFCKQILWPIFHYVLPDNLRSKGYEDGSWKHYVAVNQAFADTIIENYRQGDTIWVNDYHLMLVPNMIRERLPDASIGFFLHIPFPSSEIFRCLHVRKEVLQGLLGADLVGFQTYSFARHFLQTCSRILSVESSPKGIQLENTAVNVGIFPI
ncbi:hypothetical protein BGW38_002132, partial [Lunasporangiospora selenospora]